MRPGRFWLGILSAALLTAPGSGSEVAAAQNGTVSSNLSVQGLQASLKAAGYVESGNKCMDGKRYAEAVKEYTRALDLEPDNPRTLRLRSLAYMAQGRTDLGGEDLRRALKLEADCPTSNSADSCKAGK